MQILQQTLATITAMVMALSAQTANLSKSINPQNQLAQVVGTITQPTFMQEIETAWNTSASPKTTASFDVQSGDVLVAYAANEGADVPSTISIAGGSLAWNLQQSVTANQYAGVFVWTATVDANKSMTVSFTSSGGSVSNQLFGGNVLVFRNSGGIGASAKSNATGAPSLNITTIQPNSAVAIINGDWSALTGSTAWRTAGAFSELTNYVNANYGVHGGYYANVGSASAYTLGMTSPASQKYSIIAVEVKGTSAGGTVVTPPPSDTTAPSTPSNLSVTAVSSSQINLSWSASTDAVGVTGYNIYRGGTKIGTSATNSYSNSGLSASTNYSYTVSAYDAVGNTSSQSSSASATTQAQQSQSGSSCSATNIRCVGSGQEYTSISSAISASSAGDTVLVYPGSYGSLSVSKSGTSGNPITIQSQTKGSASVSGISISGRYIVVDGFNSSDGVNVAGGSSFVTVSNNNIHDIGGVGVFVDGYSSAVSNVNILSNEISKGQHDGIDLWGNTSDILIQGNYVHDLQPGADADHVDMIQAYGTSNMSNNRVTVQGNYAKNIQEGILFKDFPTTNLTIKDNVLFTSGPWEVYIFQATGVTVLHNTAAAINFDGTTKNITLQNNIAGQIAVLNGNATFTARGYNLAGGYVGLSNTTGDITGSPTYTGGSNPSTWAGYQLASNSKGYRAGSDGLDMGANYYGGTVVTPPPSDTTAPSTPSNLSVTAVSSSQINLSWSASTDAVGVTGYKIYRAGTQIGTSATNSYTDSGLSASTAYSYTVSAYDVAGNTSSQSLSASATTQAGAVSTKFVIGQSVASNGTVNVRQNPAGTQLDQQTVGATGKIIGGPTAAVFNGVNIWWWNVNFDSGTDGWVGEDGLDVFTAPIAGDFNSDGLVNSIDLSLLTSYWNQNNSTYDLNHDGIINSLDYVIMVQNWSL